MRRHELVIRIELPRWSRRRWVAIGVVLAIAGGAAVYADVVYTPPTQVQLAGKPLSSAGMAGYFGDVKSKFDDVDTRLTGAADCPPGYTNQNVAGITACKKIEIEPKSGLEFTWQPGGTFHYGCEPQDSRCEVSETPGRSVAVEGFWLGKTTVTVEAFARCVNAGICAPPSSDLPSCTWGKGKDHKDKYPLTCLDRSEASKFCEWIGGRLPTAEEWEWAAKGGESRIYPWGNDPPDGSKALFGQDYAGGPAPADSHGDGATTYGLFNMTGNVWQWTAGKFSSGDFEVRGGSWIDPAERLRASNRSRYDPGRLGFVAVRCLLDRRPPKVGCRRPCAAPPSSSPMRDTGR